MSDIAKLANSKIQNALTQHLELFDNLMGNSALIKQIEEAGLLLASVIQRDGKILICGNGGSAADSMHFAAELTGKFKRARPAFMCVPLLDPCHLTCVANDFGFEEVFARGVEAHGRAGDVLIAISTSGKSPNVVKALSIAAAYGMKTVFLGGKLCPEFVSHSLLVVPSNTDVGTDRIQEMHGMILHILVEVIETALISFFGQHP